MLFYHRTMRSHVALDLTLLAISIWVIHPWGENGCSNNGVDFIIVNKCTKLLTDITDAN